MHVHVSKYMSVHHAQEAKDVRRGHGCLATGVIGGCGIPCGYWELNPGTL